MKVIKDVTITFDPNKLFDALFEELIEVGIIGARRMEQEAKQFLSERIGENLLGDGESKSSGTLEESITGFVDIRYGFVQAGVKASALELGQWESSQGEEEEAARTTSDPPFDYAQVVEEGSGFYGPQGTPIVASGGVDMRFWIGQFNDEGQKVVYRAPAVRGQKPKRFLSDALISAAPGILQLFKQVGKNIRVTDSIRWS